MDSDDFASVSEKMSERHFLLLLLHKAALQENSKGMAKLRADHK